MKSNRLWFKVQGSNVQNLASGCQLSMSGGVKWLLQIYANGLTISKSASI